MKRRAGPRKRPSPIQGLRARLSEAEATLSAIRTGEVDAVVVSGPGGERTLAIEGATHPYHVLLNAMSDGAALLETDGTILFGNRRLAEIADARIESLQGALFHRLVGFAERPRFAEFLRESVGCNGSREFTLVGENGSATPVWVAISTVPIDAGAPSGPALRMAIITDLTDRKWAEATRLGLMKRLISAEDDERRRIARELHDETGQSLTALLVGLRAIEEQAVTVDVQSAARQLRSVAAQTVDNVGRLARGLHPSVLDDMGLAAAARRYVSDYAKSFGVSVDLRLDDGVSQPLPSLAQTTMYRILQEALTNVARHAQAKRVAVELAYSETNLELLVRDDGVGFDVNAALEEATGLGLHGMRERVALLDGSVEIESRPRNGTTVRVRIPVVVAPPPDKPGLPSVNPTDRTRSRARH